jgi:hypothetical protein
MSPITPTGIASTLEKCCEAWLKGGTSDTLCFGVLLHSMGLLHCGVKECQSVDGDTSTIPLEYVPASAPKPDLAALVDSGPYHNLAPFFDIWDLCQLDASCRELRHSHRSSGSAWFARGEQDWQGIHLGDDGVYSSSSSLDWKKRYLHFSQQALTFSLPFSGREIHSVQEADECAQLLSGVRTDMLQNVGLYMELEVLGNPDRLTISVTDWDVGGCSSLSFSPDAGMVFIERAPFSLPKQVSGKYLNALPALDQKQPFHGELGLFVNNGRIAFFRRCRNGKVTSQKGECVETGTSDEGHWETSGYVTDLTWAAGNLLTPCVAFRHAGDYRVKIGKVCSKSPMSHEAICGVTAAAVTAARPRWQCFNLDETE